MTDYIWPSSIVPTSSDWRLISNTAAFISPLSGTTRTVARGGDRWACTLTFSNLPNSSRAMLQAFLAQLRGQTNRVWIRDHSYRKRGNFATSNLFPPVSTPSLWSALYATATAADDSVRITATSHSAGQAPQISLSPSLSNGLVYAMRALFTRSSTGTASVGPFLGDGGGTTSSYSTAVGLKTISIQANGTAATAAVVGDSTGASMATGDYADVSYASLSRCMQVYGGSQTGASVNLGALGSTSTGVLLAGDRIEIDGHLYMLTERLDSTSSPSSTAYIMPPLRSSPADHTPVILVDPLCKMILSNNTVGWSNVAGGLSSFSIEFMEDLA